MLCMALTTRLQVAGLAIASAVSSTVYALLLLLPLERKGEERVFNSRFWLDMAKTLTATVLMALAAWLVMTALAGLLPGGKLGELVLLGVTAMVGVAAYFVAAVLLRIPETALILQLAKRILKRGG